MWREAWEIANPGETWRGGRHADRWCDELQTRRKTSKKSARSHLKSSVLYAFIGWLVFKRDFPKDILYISYSEDLASHHTSEIKKILKAGGGVGGFFSGLAWDSDAASVISCHWDDKPVLSYSVEPAGVNTFKRGLHPHAVICDDILRDPTMRKLNIDQLLYVNSTFREQISMMAKQDIGCTHVWGTPQDTEDLFAENEKKPEWFCTEEKAYTVRTINDEHPRSEFVPLWPEMYSFPRLMEIRCDIFDKAFNKEMMCAPVRGEESYFSDAAITAIIDPSRRNFDLLHDQVSSTYSYVVAGMDLGKKRHPSHLSVGGLLPNGKLEQIYHKFMDGWEYTAQVEHVRNAEGVLGIDLLKYDNTRGEFEALAEQGNLPACMSVTKQEKPGAEPKDVCPVSLSGRGNFAMAASMDRYVNRGRLSLLADARQKRLILAVDSDLHAVETTEGHGDSFFSIGLMCLAADEYADETRGVQDPNKVKGEKAPDPETEAQIMEQMGLRVPDADDATHGSETLQGLGSFS